MSLRRRSSRRAKHLLLTRRRSFLLLLSSFPQVSALFAAMAAASLLGAALDRWQGSRQMTALLALASPMGAGRRRRGKKRKAAAWVWGPVAPVSARPRPHPPGRLRLGTLLHEASNRAEVSHRPHRPRCRREQGKTWEEAACALLAHCGLPPVRLMLAMPDNLLPGSVGADARVNNPSLSSALTLTNAENTGCALLALAFCSDSSALRFAAATLGGAGGLFRSQQQQRQAGRRSGRARVRAAGEAAPPPPAVALEAAALLAAAAAPAAPAAQTDAVAEGAAARAAGVGAQPSSLPSAEAGEASQQQPPATQQRLPAARAPTPTPTVPPQAPPLGTASGLTEPRTDRDDDPDSPRNASDCFPTSPERPPWRAKRSRIPMMELGGAAAEARGRGAQIPRRPTRGSLLRDESMRGGNADTGSAAPRAPSLAAESGSWWGRSPWRTRDREEEPPSADEAEAAAAAPAAAVAAAGGADAAATSAAQPGGFFGARANRNRPGRIAVFTPRFILPTHTAHSVGLGRAGFFAGLGRRVQPVTPRRRQPGDESDGGAQGSRQGARAARRRRAAAGPGAADPAVAGAAAAAPPKRPRRIKPLTVGSPGTGPELWGMTALAFAIIHEARLLPAGRLAAYQRAASLQLTLAAAATASPLSASPAPPLARTADGAAAAAGDGAGEGSRAPEAPLLTARSRVRRNSRTPRQSFTPRPAPVGATSAEMPESAPQASAAPAAPLPAAAAAQLPGAETEAEAEAGADLLNNGGPPQPATPVAAAAATRSVWGWAAAQPGPGGAAPQVPGAPLGSRPRFDELVERLRDVLSRGRLRARPGAGWLTAARAARLTLLQSEAGWWEPSDALAVSLLASTGAPLVPAPAPAGAAALQVAPSGLADGCPLSGFSAAAIAAAAPEPLLSAAASDLGPNGGGPLRLWATLLCVAALSPGGPCALPAAAGSDPAAAESLRLAEAWLRSQVESSERLRGGAADALRREAATAVRAWAERQARSVLAVQFRGVPGLSGPRRASRRGASCVRGGGESTSSALQQRPCCRLSRVRRV